MRFPKSRKARLFIDADILLDVTLPIELKNANEGRTKHFGAADSRRKKYERRLRQSGHERRPFKRPVIVMVSRIMGKGQAAWDSSSCGRGNYKELEDALVACGWFRDDSSRWIRNTFFFQDSSRRDAGPSTRITVVAADGCEFFIGEEGCTEV